MRAFFARREERGLLDPRKAAHPMLWIVAVMLFLTVLAAALGLAMHRAGQALDRQLASRLTVQVTEAQAATRDAHVAELMRVLRARPGVARATEVDRGELARLLEPWLGGAGLDPELPMPALIDVDLRDASEAAVVDVETAVKAAVPGARIDRHARWLSPVRGFVSTLTWIAAALVLLIAGACAAVVLLAARAGLDTHRDTIEVLHMLGSTDVQVARLFQRRIALDTLTGGLLGAMLAGALVVVVQARAGALGSEMLGGGTLGAVDWLLLALLPVLFTLLAMAAARLAVLTALGRTL